MLLLQIRERDTIDHGKTIVCTQDIMLDKILQQGDGADEGGVATDVDDDHSRGGGATPAITIVVSPLRSSLVADCRLSVYVFLVYNRWSSPVPLWLIGSIFKFVNRAH
jgi:hypothetical protein